MACPSRSAMTFSVFARKRAYAAAVSSKRAPSIIVSSIKSLLPEPLPSTLFSLTLLPSEDDVRDATSWRDNDPATVADAEGSVLAVRARDCNSVQRSRKNYLILEHLIDLIIAY